MKTSSFSLAVAANLLNWKTARVTTRSQQSREMPGSEGDKDLRTDHTRLQLLNRKTKTTRLEMENICGKTKNSNLLADCDHSMTCCSINLIQTLALKRSMALYNCRVNASFIALGTSRSVGYCCTSHGSARPSPQKSEQQKKHFNPGKDP